MITQNLLYLSELFYEINEKEKSIELSKTINEKISSIHLYLMIKIKILEE